MEYFKFAHHKNGGIFYSFKILKERNVEEVVCYGVQKSFCKVVVQVMKIAYRDKMVI